MHPCKKQTLQRKICQSKERSSLSKLFKMEIKSSKQTLIIKAHKQMKNELLCIESAISELSLCAKQKNDSLPRLTTSVFKTKSSEKDRLISNIYSALSITTSCWCLYDSNTKKYHGFRQEYRREIASLTKIMTTHLTIQIIEKFQLSLNCMVRLTRAAAEIGGTTAELKENAWISLQDLLYGTMLPSGNDAAFTLAQYMGYVLQTSSKSTKMRQSLSLAHHLDLSKQSTAAFVQEFISHMNDNSLKLGLYSTRFSNPHGLQNALNTSSAKDITILSQQATKNKLFSKVMSTYYYKYELFEGENFKSMGLRKWWNTNKLLMKGWEGVKTGQTVTAGSCLCSLREGIFITVLNSDTADSRFTDTQKIFNWYRNYFSGELRRLDSEKLRESYSRKFEKRLPSMLTEVSL